MKQNLIKKFLTASLLFVIVSGSRANAQIVTEAQAGFPTMSVPSWHWLRQAPRKVDLSISSKFDGTTLIPGLVRRIYDWDGSRAGFPFKFSFWESNANPVSQVAGGYLNLRIKWFPEQNSFLGGFVRTDQRFADGLYQVKSVIDLSEKGWVHGFWMFVGGHEIDIYEIKGYGADGKDQRTHMPTNLHRNIGGTDRLPGFEKNFTGLASAANGSTYAMLRGANYVEFFNNGNLMRRVDKGTNTYLGEVFATPSYVILNSEYQSWIGKPTNKTATWNHKIDYFARYIW